MENNTENANQCWYRGENMKFNKFLYSKVSLIKAAYNFTDVAYLHLDADDEYYYVSIEPKQGFDKVTEYEFVNEMLTQAVRHEIYQQTKSIRELMLARTLATSVIMEDESMHTIQITDQEPDENSILKDWYAEND